jgi:hypothetical protein
MNFLVYLAKSNLVYTFLAMVRSMPFCIPAPNPATTWYPTHLVETFSPFFSPPTDRPNSRNLILSNHRSAQSDPSRIKSRKLAHVDSQRRHPNTTRRIRWQTFRSRVPKRTESGPFVGRPSKVRSGLLQSSPDHSHSVRAYIYIGILRDHNISNQILRGEASQPLFREGNYDSFPHHPHHTIIHSSRLNGSSISAVVIVIDS